MRTALVLFAIVLSMTCLATAQAAPSPAEIQTMLDHAKVISLEAQSLIREMQAVQPVGASSVSASSITDIFGEVEKAIKNLNLTMEDLQNLLRTTSSTVEGVGKATEGQINGIGDTVQSEIGKLGERLGQNLKDLDASIDRLIETTNGFIEESTVTLHDIMIASEKAVGLISKLDGSLSVGMYGSTDGLDSEAILRMWYEGSNNFVLIGVSDIDTFPRLDAEGGFIRGPLSIGFGFVEEGIGGSISYDPPMGIGVRAKVARLRDPLIDVRVGYMTSAKMRPFVFVDGILHDVTVGGGISYGVGF